MDQPIPPPVQDGKIEQIQKEIDLTTEIMKKNIQNTIDNGNKLEQLQIKTQDLAEQSSTFKLSARKIKRNLCLVNYKTTASIICIIGTILGLCALTIYVHYTYS